jgi:hypothetical protein
LSIQRGETTVAADRKRAGIRRTAMTIEQFSKPVAHDRQVLRR